MLHNKTVITVLCAAVLIQLSAFSLNAGSVWAQSEKASSKAKGGVQAVVESATSKTIRGTVSYADDKYVAVVYDRNDETGEESEAGFWLDQAVEFSRAKDMSKINVGDVVDVRYDEVEEQYSEVKNDGTVTPKTRVKERKAKGLTFIAPAKSGLRSQ